MSSTTAPTSEEDEKVLLALIGRTPRDTQAEPRPQIPRAPRLHPDDDTICC